MEPAPSPRWTHANQPDPAAQGDTPYNVKELTLNQRVAGLSVRWCQVVSPDRVSCQFGRTMRYFPDGD